MKFDVTDYQFSDLATFSYGKMPKKSKIKANGKYPIYSGYRYVGYYDEYNIEPRQLIVVARGVGGTGDVKITTEKCYLTNLSIAVKITETEKVLPEYLYYLFKLNNLRYLDSGSAQSQITINDLGKVHIDLPSINWQKKIVNLLLTIDDKIATNTAINKNLEDMLQAVYQNMFSSEPQNMLAEICSYSKDRVPVSELTVDDYYSTENMLPQKAGATTATNLPATSQVIKCHVGDVLVSNIRPYFKKILYCYRDCGCSNDVLCFTPKSKNMTAFLYATLYADRFFDFMALGAKGTKMPRGDKQQIMTHPIVLPSEKELDSFNSIAFPLMQNIYNNTSENARLSSLRDTILPRLMSGEIDVSNVEV